MTKISKQKKEAWYGNTSDYLKLIPILKEIEDKGSKMMSLCFRKSQKNIWFNELNFS